MSTNPDAVASRNTNQHGGSIPPMPSVPLLPNLGGVMSLGAMVN